VKRLTSIVIVFSIATFSSASRGGGGPMSLDTWHGKVEVKPLDNWSHYRAGFGARNIQLKRAWQPVRKGEYIGAYLFRSQKYSWMHLGNNTVCLDSNSVLRVDSEADIAVRLLKGHLSKADGKRGKSILKVGQQIVW
jgi:hypothetical protein